MAKHFSAAELFSIEGGITNKLRQALSVLVGSDDHFGQRFEPARLDMPSATVARDKVLRERGFVTDDRRAVHQCFEQTPWAFGRDVSEGHQMARANQIHHPLPITFKAWEADRFGHAEFGNQG